MDPVNLMAWTWYRSISHERRYVFPLCLALYWKALQRVGGSYRAEIADVALRHAKRIKLTIYHFS